MLNVIFKNPDLAAKRLGCSKSSIYSWLNGNTPNLATMLRVYEIYQLNISLDYMYNFFTIIKHILKLHHLDEITEYITISGLSKEDKTFLKEYFKNKYWKNNG